MRTVRDESDTHYVLIKQSSDASLVRDPETGVEKHIPNEDIVAVDGASPLATAATAVPEAVRTVVTAVHDDQTLGLLVELDARGPLPAADLVSSTDLCESDFVGLVTELRAAGLLAETTVAGEPGYETTETAAEALDVLAE